MYKSETKIDNLFQSTKVNASLDSFLIRNLLFHFHSCNLDMALFGFSLSISPNYRR